MNNEILPKQLERRRAYREAGMAVVSRQLEWHRPDAEVLANWEHWLDNTAYLLLSGAIAEYRAMEHEPEVDMVVLTLLRNLAREAHDIDGVRQPEYSWWTCAERIISDNWQRIEELVNSCVRVDAWSKDARQQWQAAAEWLTNHIEHEPSLLASMRDLIDDAAYVLGGYRMKEYCQVGVKSRTLGFRYGSELSERV
jgi:hypothetical protein